MSLKSILQQVGNSVTSQVPGLNSQTSVNTSLTDPTNVAWQNQTDSFFSPIDLDPTRADKIFPYKLLVIDVKRGNQIVDSGPNGDLFTKQNSDTGGAQYRLTPNKSWEITLPITPQQLSITDQFAINTTATMRGVVEEHNGVKFKIISASGTTGIWPSRSTFEDPSSGQGLSLFGGTLEALGGVVSAADTLANGGKTKPAVLDYKTDAGGGNTGYFQALLIQQFLEQYAMAKKKAVNKHWRLVFHCPKTNESFVVTPMQYTVTKSQRSPGESLYNMQFKAWKRVDLKGGTAASSRKVQELDPNFFQTLNNSLDNARSLMSASLNVIKAVRADFRKPFDALRKVTLLAKDFAGLAVALSDLPNQINQDITSATKKRTADLRLATGGTGGGGGSRSRASQAKITQTRQLIQSNFQNNEGLSDDYIESGGNGTEARNANRISPINNVFNEPEGNFDFFNTINVDELELNIQQRNAIRDEIEETSLLSVEDVKGFISEIQNLTLDLANNFGAGDSFFATVYGRPAPRKRATPMTIEEFELLSTLEEAVLNMNMLVATRNFDDVRTESSLEYVGGLASDAGIPFNASYTGKYLAPVPFGLTIQEIAARYMGDADLYNEIITINNLRSPYIDEEGFFYSLLSNGDGRQFNIAENKNLFIGQVIQLSSNTVPTFTRKITAIERITDTNYLITLDGLSNLDNLTIAEQAKIKAFLPGTVNSQNQIYIPSNDTIDEEPRTFDIPFLQGDTLTGLSKIDWLLADNGDIVLNSFGEASLANGLNNLVQALKMKINTPKGGILTDPNFGLGIEPGVNSADISVETIMSDMKEMILADSRFESIDKIEVNVLPPTVSIAIKIRLANGRGIFPINFTV